MEKRRSEEKLDKLLVDFTEGLPREADESLDLGSARHISFLSERTDESFTSFEDRALSLLDTIRTISSVIQPKQPSEEFIARVSRAAQERLQSQVAESEELREQISAEKIQRIIGMAVTEKHFRESFFRDIVAACRGAGFNLTTSEIAALRSLKEEAVKEFANSLDERITKFFPVSLP